MRVFRFLFLISLTFFVSACGFSPVYGTHDNGSPVIDQLNLVTIDNIPDHNGQILRNYLIDRMYRKGRPQLPTYTLKVKLHYNVQDIGVQANATSTRTILETFGDYSLLDTKEKEVVHGTAHSVTSFDKLSDQYNTLASSESAYDRTIHEISEQIVNRLSVYFADGPVKSSAP